MQVISPSSPAPRFAGKERFSEVYGELNDDFGSKLKISSKEEENRDDDSWWNQNGTDKDDEGREDDFSFASVNADNSPITADEAFEDGQIRPVYPLFNRNLFFDDPEEKTLRSPLKKLFVESTTTEEEEEESDTVGPYCSWTNRTVEQASPETCRKSNSTGFSKLWRFRDLVLRSNSDGKDAFVFLSNGSSSTSSTSSTAARLSGVVKSSEKGKEKTKTEKKKNKMRTKSAHEKLYMRNRAMREEGKRRSYLPYKHVGFFTNVNGLTRNVHPY
ncbi:hypothetical protein AtNW77_Chr1g0071661 [Arabidopsis thaliana]|uniref:Uncharacterized protein n=2 Tax=Arabidopsis TaxID=3701 RepID=A0A178WN17_ARATH|nr:hypothetical protein ISN45_At01g061140 [Arabidopsis thaliana x Arabidopsis arenosa]OAP19677.1 hypothetical protein AXX17_AT1G64560 [Arabidopsis thaliana]